MLSPFFPHPLGPESLLGLRQGKIILRLNWKLFGASASRESVLLFPLSCRRSNFYISSLVLISSASAKVNKGAVTRDKEKKNTFSRINTKLCEAADWSGSKTPLSEWAASPLFAAERETMCNQKGAFNMAARDSINRWMSWLHFYTARISNTQCTFYSNCFSQSLVFHSIMETRFHIILFVLAAPYFYGIFFHDEYILPVCCNEGWVEHWRA